MLTTGVGGGSLQHPGCGRRRDLIMEEVHGISNSIPFVADISMKKLCHQSMAYITMEWRGQQHARGAVESTASGATSTIQVTSFPASLSADRMKKSMEDSMPEWRVDLSIQKSSVFQYTTRVEGSSYSSVIGLFSYKSNNNKFQVFLKPATV